MNQTQVNIFLSCLSNIDDTNYVALRSSLSEHDEHQMHQNDVQQHEAESSDIIVAKAITMTVLFSTAVIFGLIPFILNRHFKWTEKQSTRSALVVQCLLYFGGGVLLATTFLHLLPEVQEVVETMEHCDILPELNFPLAELLMCVGFFFMYFIEEAIHAFIHHHHKRLNIEEASAASAFERGHSVRRSYLVARASNNNKSNDEDANCEKGEVESIEKAAAPAPAASVITITTAASNENSSMSEASEAKCHQHYHEHHHSHLPPLNDTDNILTSSIRGLFIVLALSLHELFEGMAIGLESASSTAVWFMFGAVSAHKLVLSFCVGVELIVARTRLLLAIIYVTTFAIVSPIGIAIGILLSSGDSGAAQSIPAAILQGLACGTLLYVVFFEILSKEHSGLVTYLALVVGFVTMFALQNIGAGGHSHGACNHVHDESEHSHSHSIEDAANTNGYAEQIRMLRKASENILKKRN